MLRPSRLRALTGMISAKLNWRGGGAGRAGIEAVALAGAHRNDLGKVELAGERVDEREQMVLLHEVDLGEDEKDRAIELADEAEEELVFAGPVGTSAVRRFRDLGCLGLQSGCPRSLVWDLRFRTTIRFRRSNRGRRPRRFQLHSPRSIHQNKHHVARFEGLVNLLQHAAVKLRAGLVDTGRIYKNDLRGRVCTLVGRDLDHAHDAIARGLRLGGDDGPLFGGKGVEERAFADVGPAENGNKSRFQWVVVLLLSIIADWKVER